MNCPTCWGKLREDGNDYSYTCPECESSFTKEELQE